MSSAPAPSELTWRAVLLGAVLSALLAAANAYLGLFAGMTVSASIPAAVVSMAILRTVRGSLLENNLVQTSASSGEAVAAGAIFTLPALLLLGAWQEMHYLWTLALVGTGGALGVLFTIPLRRVLIESGSLPFPEGVATAQVLQAGHAQGTARGGVVWLLRGALVGSVVKLLESGGSVLRAVLEGATWVGSRVVAGGVSISPALLAVGYIVGFPAASVVLLGGVINWGLVLPWVATGPPEAEAAQIAWEAWSTKTRFLGVGAMAVGGVSALVQMRSSLFQAVRALFLALWQRGGPSEQEEHKRDLSGKVLLGCLAVATVVLLAAMSALVHSWTKSVLLVLLVLGAGFLFCAVAAYMAGLVGSSNNPVSGVTIATVLLTSGVLLLLGEGGETGGGFAGPASAILVGTAVCTAAALGGDNMQDLKAGHLLGASPWRQQVVQFVGVFAAALVIAPVLNLLADVYGFGLPTEEHPRPLRAPQATLMAAVASGVFGGELPLPFVLGGAVLALVCWGLDSWLVASGRSFRVPPLALAIGLYLPLELSVTVFLGGLCAFLVGRLRAPREAGQGSDLGVLLGAGLITGEALAGLALAVWVGSGRGLPSLAWGGSGLASALVLILVFALLLRSGAAQPKV